MSSFHEPFHEGTSNVVRDGDAERFMQVGAVPRVGFEPKPPPPEAGRSRDPGSLLAFYLGSLFAALVSGDLLCAVVRSTRHSTAGVLSGQVRGPRAPRSRRSP